MDATLLQGVVAENEGIGDFRCKSRGIRESDEKAFRRITYQIEQQVIEKQGINTSIRSYWSQIIAQGTTDCAKESGAEVIVIGTKGLTGVGKFVMGCLASSIINNAHCPVVSIR